MKQHLHLYFLAMIGITNAVNGQMYISNFSNPATPSSCDGSIVIIAEGTGDVTAVLLFDESGLNVGEGSALNPGIWLINNICEGVYEVRVFNGAACLSKALTVSLVPCSDPVFDDLIISAAITPVASGADGRINVLANRSLDNIHAIWHGPDGLISNSLELANIGVGQYTLQLNDGCGNYTSQSFQVRSCSDLSAHISVSTTDLCYNFSGSGGAAHLNLPEGYAPGGLSWSTGEQDVESIFNIHSTDQQMVFLDFGTCTIQKEFALTLVRDYNLEAEGFLETNNLSMCSNSFNGKPEIYLVTSNAFNPLYNPYMVTWPDGQVTEFDVADGVPLNTSNWRSFFVEDPGIYAVKIENGLGCSFTHTYEFGTEILIEFLFDAPRSVVDLDLYSDVVPSGSAIVGKRACTQCGISIFRNCVDHRYKYEPLDPYEPCAGGGTIKTEGGGFVTK